MSADNLIHCFPFQKMTGAVVWRVLELRLSGFDRELLLAMSTQARYREFKEFSGRNACQQALAAGRRMMRALHVCEYGMSVVSASQEPLTMQALRDLAVENGGWDPSDMAQVLEASDAVMSKLPKGYLVEVLG